MACTQPSLSELCVGRFARLRDALQDLRPEDWADFEPLEAASLLPEQLRPLAAAFHRHLSKRGYFDDDFEEHASAPGGTTLNLSRLVTSKIMPGGRHLDQILRNLSSQDLTLVKRVDLRYCSLMDMDASDVETLCQALTAARASEVVVDLTGNRFTEDSIPLFSRVCSLGAIQYLVCPDVGHIGAIGKLRQAPAAFFDCFIFIREIHLPTVAGWRTLVPGDLQQRVEQVHIGYYERYPTFRSLD